MSGEAAQRTGLPREQRMLILLVGTSLLINNYDLGIFALALPQIQASLGIAEEEVGLYTGLIRLGVLLSFPLVFMADVVGRRRLLLITIAGMTLATVLTAFSQTAAQYLILQTFARTFSYAEDMLCFVIVIEEIDARYRGWALGRLAALGALGYGLSALLYGTIDLLPNGWRDFYLIGALGLAVILIARRNLRETKLFTEHKTKRMSTIRTFHEHLRPVASLVRAYPGRFWAMVATTAPYSFGLAAAFAFMSKFLQETHGFAPHQVGMLQFFGGAVAVLGYFIAGRLADRFGRRRVLVVSVLSASVLLATFYWTDNPTLLIAVWIGGIFAFFASEVTLSALGGELFPTSYRSTSSAARGVINVVAGLAGLASESFLYTLTGSHTVAVLSLIAVAPFAVIAVVMAIPETATQELDEISPEIEIDPAPFP